MNELKELNEKLPIMAEVPTNQETEKVKKDCHVCEKHSLNEVYEKTTIPAHACPNKAKKQLTKIQGLLTSRIETRNKAETLYHYGFFQFEGLAIQIPVIFKTPEKPTIPKGSEV